MRSFSHHGAMTQGGLVLLVAIGLLAACHGDSGQPPVVKALPHHLPAPAESGQTPDQATAGMVEAVTVGKSTVPVNVKFEFSARPMVGQPLDVVIAVMPQIAADPAILMISDSALLPLSPGVGSVEMPAVDPAQVYRHTFRVTPSAEGVQLLGLSVSLKHDEITETRVFSVPIIVAAGTDGATSTKH